MKVEPLVNVNHSSDRASQLSLHFEMSGIDKFRVPYQPNNDFSCPSTVCEFVGTDPQHLFRHLRKNHKKEKIQIKCIHSVNCFHTEDFVSFANLNYHLNTYHAIFFQLGKCSDEPLLSEQATENLVIDDIAPTQDVMDTLTVTQSGLVLLLKNV